MTGPRFPPGNICLKYTYKERELPPPHFFFHLACQNFGSVSPTLSKTMLIVPELCCLTPTNLFISKHLVQMSLITTCRGSILVLGI